MENVFIPFLRWANLDLLHFVGNYVQFVWRYIVTLL